MKVSVVVPTYNIGEGVRRLVGTLDNQSMSHDDFEAIFVDDGSADDTVAVLDELAGSRPWMRVMSIENSGWPSRPRNTGLDASRGEYVAFADHDDKFFTTGLQAAYDFAVAAGSDVLSAKESTTGVVSWGMEQYTENLPNAIDQFDPFPLAPLNPHKLYRRAFLLEHNIRFKEGRRVLYEDNMFNISCYAHARVISVLSDTPYYEWVRDGKATGTTSFRRDADEYWSAIEGVLSHAKSLLDGYQLAQARLYQHRIRFAGYFRPDFATRSAGRATQDLAHMRRIVDEHLPPELDAPLASPLRAKMALFRADAIDELRELAAWDHELVGTNTLVECGVVAGGRIRLVTDTCWRDDQGNGPRLRLIGDRWQRQVPPAVARVLPPQAIDMTADLEMAKVSIGVYDKASATTWLLPTQTHQLRAEKNGDFDDPIIRTESVFDPGAVPGVAELARIRWQLNVFTRFADKNQQRRLRSEPGSIALWSSRTPATIHTDDNGWVSLDLTPGATGTSVVAGIDDAYTTITEQGPALVLSYPDTIVEPGAYSVEVGLIPTNRYTAAALRRTHSNPLRARLTRTRRVPLVNGDATAAVAVIALPAHAPTRRAFIVDAGGTHNFTVPDPR